MYIDGTKITANANKYSWVWKKSCEKNRVKVFAKITELLSEINKRIAAFGVKFGVREEYAIEYLEQILKQYIQLCGLIILLLSGDVDIIKLQNSDIMISLQVTLRD